MKLFKNGVGRPSNEIKHQRKVFVVSVAAIVISIVALLVSLITNTSIKSSELKGSTSDEKNTLGDVCGSRVNTGPNDVVDLIDTLCILKFSAKTKTPTSAQKKNADLNKDGKITAADAKKSLNDLKKKFKKGDVDFDGRLTDIDYGLINYYMYYQTSVNSNDFISPYLDEDLKSIFEYMADVNEDGKITNADLDKIVESGALIADANGDGKVSKTDAKCILAYELGFHNENKDFCSVKIKKGSYNFSAADVNGDGKINVSDAVGVFKKLTNTGILEVDKSAIYSIWGDTNADLVLTEEDADSVLKNSYINRKSVLHDLNFDNEVNAADARIILNVLSVKKGKYGDLDSDGKLTEKDAKKYVKALKKAKFKTANVTKNADANRDGKSNNNDFYLMLALASNSVGVGDIDGDGKIGIADLRILLRYLNGLSTKDAEGNKIKVNKANADFNMDGLIDYYDYNWMLWLIGKVKFNLY